MSEFGMETRRRSRSKTPFLRSSCDHEACEHAGEPGHEKHTNKKKLAPRVQTIIEEAVEVTSSSSATPSSKLTQSKAQQKQKTSDYSSEDASPESKDAKKSTVKEQKLQTSSTSATTTTSSSTTIITKSKRISASGGATSTPKSHSFLDSFAAQFSSAGSESRRGLKEVAQNEMNSEFERSQKQAAQSSSKIGRSLSRIFGSSTPRSEQQSLDGYDSDHLAYMEYKRAGEYWKTTPKTDYTYSELSPHRRVLAPGIVAMPNMSRRSLENHHERINYMVERDPAQEEFIRRRYETSKYQQNRRATERLVYDSGDEADYIGFEGHKHQQNVFNGKGASQYGSAESWFVRFLTTIVTTITTTWTTVTGGGGGGGGVGGGGTVDESYLYSTKFTQRDRGFLGSIAHGIAASFASVFRYVYLAISSILCLDTWLLQSSNPENKSKKRFLLFLLILLPLLLLAGAYYYLHPNEPFPPKHFSEYTITLPSLPALPKIDMTEYLNQEQYEAFKTQAYTRLDDFRTWANDYAFYLRTVSRNIADEGRKFFLREQHYERV